MADEDIEVQLTEEIINVDLSAAGPSGPTGPTGATGPTGPAGTTNHNLLTNLDYEDSGHTGFQKQLTYDPELGAYIISN